MSKRLATIKYVMYISLVGRFWILLSCEFTQRAYKYKT